MPFPGPLLLLHAFRLAVRQPERPSSLPFLPARRPLQSFSGQLLTILAFILLSTIWDPGQSALPIGCCSV